MASQGLPKPQAICSREQCPGHETAPKANGFWKFTKASNSLTAPDTPHYNTKFECLTPQTLHHDSTSNKTIRLGLEVVRAFLEHSIYLSIKQHKGIAIYGLFVGIYSLKLVMCLFNDGFYHFWLLLWPEPPHRLRRLYLLKRSPITNRPAILLYKTVRNLDIGWHIFTFRILRRAHVSWISWKLKSTCRLAT